MFTHPIFGLQTMDPATPMKNIGAEMKEMGTSIEQILAGFNYHGADPNLVLSRVVALENARAASKLPQEGVISFAAIATGTGITVNVVFPVPFAEPPIAPWIFANQARLNIAITDVTATGFAARIDNWSGGNASLGSARWGAVGVFA